MTEGHFVSKRAAGTKAARDLYGGAQTSRQLEPTSKN